MWGKRNPASILRWENRLIGDLRVNGYIDSLDRGNEGILARIEEEATEERIPIIRPQVQRLIKVLLCSVRPESILEVGTATGFSAILMAQNTDPECRITTIEKYKKRIPRALENFKRAGFDERISLIEGDAADILKELADDGAGYDFIFMDAAKGQYINFYDNVTALLNKGGMLVSDNVLQDGDIIESRFAVTRRNRTIHSRMREYLYRLTHDDRLETTVLPIGDGVTVSVYKGI